MRPVTATLILLALVFGWVSLGAAQDGRPGVEESPIPLRFDGCGPLAEPTRAFLALELDGALGVALSANVHCAEMVVTIRVHERDGPRSLGRELMLAEAADPSRLLALAIAELVAEARLIYSTPAPDSVESNPSPVESNPGPIESNPSPVESSDASESEEGSNPARFQLHAMAIGELSSSPIVPRAGGGVGVDFAFLSWLRGALDGQVLAGSLYRTGADIVLMDLSGSASLTAQLDFEPIGLGLELGVRVGGLRIHAQPRDSSSAEGRERLEPYIGPLGALRADWTIGRGLALRARVEIGVNPRGIVSISLPEQQEIHRFEGAWGSVSMGVAFSPF